VGDTGGWWRQMWMNMGIFDLLVFAGLLFEYNGIKGIYYYLTFLSFVI